MEEVPGHVHPGPIVPDASVHGSFKRCTTDRESSSPTSDLGLVAYSCIAASATPFLHIELTSRDHKVITYNSREGIYLVKSPIRIDGTDNNVYILKMNNKSCSCGK
ncbi:hypothetical protein M9H77_17284 [Catharanthus roseus]|uniref:Uncharacterized protein n=1 Tax=Catharanthus roseus TaxID=4058 RepID=A0ACC0B478_CATRO|nr:hypothetical protein M9H77_17284 [Catharanthus roseus]